MTARLLALPGRWRLALAAGGLAIALLLPADGIAGTAVRALAVLGGLGLAASAIGRSPAGPRALAVLHRETLGRDAGLAVVEVGGRTLLVGHSGRGVALLADLSPGPRP